MPNAFYEFTKGLSLKPYNDYFELLKFETMHLVLNSGSNVQIWIGLLIIGLLSTFIYNTLKGTIAKVAVTFVDFKIRYMVIVRTICQTYLALSLSSILNLTTLNW